MNKKCFLVLCMICMVLFGCSSDDELFFQETESEELKYDTEIESTELAQSNGTICVYVCGAVENPGVYELLSDSRINDAINMAGGFLEEASEDYWNLAEQLSDGQMVYVPTVEEVIEERDSKSTSASSSQQDQITDDGLIDINTATKEELTAIPGVGDSRAQSIIDYRIEHNGFKSIEEITEVSGIGEALFNKMRDCIKAS